MGVGVEVVASLGVADEFGKGGDEGSPFTRITRCPSPEFLLTGGCPHDCGQKIGEWFFAGLEESRGDLGPFTGFFGSFDSSFSTST